MSKKNCKEVLYRFATILTCVMLLAVLLLPAVISSQESGCKDACGNDCEDHGESVCGCFGCLPTTVGYVTNIFDDGYSMNVITCSIIDHSMEIEYGFLTRVDRPPQIFYA